MSSNLASQLREGTKHSHTMAENTAYMKCFLKGIVEKEPFRKLLANLYFVYSTLEAEILRHRNHPVVGLIYFPELNRQASLEKDLAFYYGEAGEAVLKDTASHKGAGEVATVYTQEGVGRDKEDKRCRDGGSID